MFYLFIYCRIHIYLEDLFAGAIMDKHGGLFQKLFKDAQAFDVKTPMTRIIPVLDKSSAVIITKNGDYFGIIDTKVLYHSGRGIDIGNAKASDFAINVPKINSSTNLDDAVYYFSKARTKVLPYVSQGKVRGILERSTLLKALLSMGVLSDIKVSEAMTTPLMGISITSNLAQAKSVMRDNHVNRLAVFDNNKFIGIISNRNITIGYKKHMRLPEMKSNKLSISNIPVSEAMERNVLTLEQNRPASDAARSFVSRDVSSIVITRSGLPIGLLTVTDLLESLASRKRIEPNRIFISGLHSLNYDYENELRGALSSFLAEMDKLDKGRIDIDYITLNIKKQKTKSYELQARLSMGRNGILTVHADGYLFEETLKELLQHLKKEVMKGKEIRITMKKSVEKEE